MAVYIVKVLKCSSWASCSSYVCGEHNFTTGSPTYLFLAKVLIQENGIIAILDSLAVLETKNGK
jgi:hypothetical protein